MCDFVGVITGTGLSDNKGCITCNNKNKVSGIVGLNDCALLTFDSIVFSDTSPLWPPGGLGRRKHGRLLTLWRVMAWDGGLHGCNRCGAAAYFSISASS